MAQDIRKLLKNTTDIGQHKMPEGHGKRFAEKLDEAMPRRRRFPFGVMKIAASVAVVISIGYISYQAFTPSDTENPIENQVVDVPEEEQTVQGITLGDISPDLKKVEDYYVTNINVELSKLAVNEENKQLFNGYMTRLTELNDEYQTLNKELNDIGPNEQTVNALIGNLQLRLQLLYKLKEKLNELKKLNNENSIEQQV